MSILFNILFVFNILLLVFIIFHTYKRTKKIIDKQRKINQLYDELTLAINNTELVKENLIQEVMLLFGEEVGEQVGIGTIWEGMPTYLLQISLGNPNQISEFKENEKAFILWFYANFTNKVENYKYGLEVYIENNRIVKWEEQKVLN
jgi:hypothetical protein